jgi:hypothetical protein
MKKQSLILLAIAAGLGYYFYSQKKKGTQQTEPAEPKENEAPPPPRERVLPPVQKIIFPYSYNPKTTIEPVAKTLDIFQNVFKPPTIVPFTLNPKPTTIVPFTLNPKPAQQQKAAKQKKAAKKKKLGDLGAGYLYV